MTKNQERKLKALEMAEKQVQKELDMEKNKKDLAQISLPLSSEDFHKLDKAIHIGTLKWTDLNENLRSAWVNFKSKKDKPMMDDFTKRGLSTPYN